MDHPYTFCWWWYIWGCCSVCVFIPWATCIEPHLAMTLSWYSSTLSRTCLKSSAGLDGTLAELIIREHPELSLIHLAAFLRFAAADTVHRDARLMQRLAIAMIHVRTGACANHVCHLQQLLWAHKLTFDDTYDEHGTIPTTHCFLHAKPTHTCRNHSNLPSPYQTTWLVFKSQRLHSRLLR